MRLLTYSFLCVFLSVFLNIPYRVLWAMSPPIILEHRYLKSYMLYGTLVGKHSFPSLIIKIKLQPLLQIYS